jgi:hypothetical protein
VLISPTGVVCDTKALADLVSDAENSHTTAQALTNALRVIRDLATTRIDAFPIAINEVLARRLVLLERRRLAFRMHGGAYVESHVSPVREQIGVEANTGPAEELLLCRKRKLSDA